MERDAVCRAQYDGWTKETVGGHIVRRCNIHHCEQTGIVGRMGCVFSIIEDNHIHHINHMQQLGGAEIAGIKFHAAIDVIFRRNHIHHCSMGIWTDWEAQGTRITRNFLHDNCIPDFLEKRPDRFDQDIFVEVGHGPMLIDNNILLSPVSLRIPTEGVAMVHNLICGSFCMVGSGVDSVVNGQREPRYTPYHIRHRTEVAGFMTILHGDDRIYNNIFIQTYPNTEDKVPSDNDYPLAGTACFDIFPTYEEWFKPFDMENNPDMRALGEAHFGHLPVWVSGNAYFSGANICKHETDKFEDKKHKVKAEIVEKNGKYSLKTNVYQYMTDFYDGIITSDILGKAFEPEQRFENPDGSAITFDSDYNGEHRGLRTIPGPFADEKSASGILW
jgi:hypothetical protein